MRVKLSKWLGDDETVIVETNINWGKDTLKYPSTVSELLKLIANMYEGSDDSVEMIEIIIEDQHVD
jgi:hypothetical protein